MPFVAHRDMFDVTGKTLLTGSVSVVESVSIALILKLFMYTSITLTPEATLTFISTL